MTPHGRIPCGRTSHWVGQCEPPLILPPLSGFARPGDVRGCGPKRLFARVGSMPAFRVFLSAVSSEFARARDALANDPGASGRIEHNTRRRRVARVSLRP